MMWMRNVERESSYGETSKPAKKSTPQQPYDSTLEDKQKVEEELRMEYDSLIDENPEIQKRVAKGKAEGEIRGELRGLQKMVLEAVKDEYPPLVELAQEKVVAIRKPDSLRQLVKLIYKAPDENTARWLLNNFAA